MNNIKSTFSIKDLENLTGIKAHTIRIWEKRYNVLEPMRTNTNIRLYDLNSLQKLLNITLLNDYGYKISKISKLNPDAIALLVNKIINEKSAKNHAISTFKMAMMNFDQNLFITTYNTLLSEKSFKEVYSEVFIPLIVEIGFLWQNDTISPAHEHFISYLIKQKLLINTEKVQLIPPTKEDTVFALYLPENEVHELGLMYLNYELIYNGYKTIYLGECVPISSLKDVKRYFNNVTFLCYATVFPSPKEIDDYIINVKKELLDSNTEFWIIGRMTQHINQKNIPNNLTVINSISEFFEKL